MNIVTKYAVSQIDSMYGQFSNMVDVLNSSIETLTKKKMSNRDKIEVYVTENRIHDGNIERARKLKDKIQNFINE